MAHKNVLIIIPVYRPELKSYEAAALANNLEKLAGYPASVPSMSNIRKWARWRCHPNGSVRPAA